MLEGLYAILMSQVVAPTLMFDLPSFKKVTVTHIEVLEREMTNDFYNFKDEGPPRMMPRRCIIDGFTEDNSTFHIGINLEIKVIESIYSVPCRGDGMGSAEIGIMIFGIPSLILTSPIWGTYLAARFMFQSVAGMDHHMMNLWRQIKRQIPTELHDDVYQAFKNHETEFAQKHLDNLSREESIRVRAYFKSMGMEDMDYGD